LARPASTSSFQTMGISTQQAIEPAMPSTPTHHRVDYGALDDNRI
jgi:hypothetical protein